METIEQMAIIFAYIFALSNKMQIIGDKMNNYMSMKQWMLIAAMVKSGRESLNIGELSKIIGTSYQNVKKLAVILEKQGFLNLQKSPSDARAILISLTEQCKKYFLERGDAETEFLLSFFVGMDEKMVGELYGGIVKLHENVQNLIEKQNEK